MHNGGSDSLSGFESPASSAYPHTQFDSGVGLSHPELEMQGRRQTLDLINRLHNTGVGKDVDLPQIAVIGSQSAGKSSLIESISGITLPRASGTCTRCPTVCRLSRSEGSWKCVVSLRLNEDGITQIAPFGEVITERSHVEARIRRAQQAILNPVTRKACGSHHFLGEEEVSVANELNFSSNAVSLEISGPDVADLSFCDLPGLIANVGRDGDTGDIELVKSLVTSHIKHPSCIILLTVTCETDFQNQGAQELAKIHDPDGKRTIGVLTKPDRIPTGEELYWISLIRNEKEPLENGWYCVKQPSSEDLKEGITWDDARKREDQFFMTRDFWSDLDSGLQKSLRTENLVKRLGGVLSDLITQRLPGIHAELESKIFRTREELNKLPKSPSKDPSNEIANLLYDFVRDLGRHIEGIPDEGGLFQSIRPAQEQFRRAIRSTAPEFVPFEKRYAGTKKLRRPKFLNSEEGIEEVGEEWDSCDENQTEDTLQASAKCKKRVARGIYVDEVLDRAHRARTRELPGNYPFVVQQTYINATIKEWHAPAHLLCRAVFNTMGEKIKSLIHAHFSSFGLGLLEHRIKLLLLDHLNKCMEQTEQRINWLLELEDTPFTLNTHYLGDYKEKFLSHYRSAREKDRNSMLLDAINDYASPTTSNSVRQTTPTGVAKILAGLVEVGINGAKPEDIAKLIPPDGTEPALNIMADVRAYFQVAYKRFADIVPIAIDHGLVRGVERNVLQFLNVGLGINGPEGHRICTVLAQENRSVSSRREELSKQLERLQAASEELLRIQ